MKFIGVKKRCADFETYPLYKQYADVILEGLPYSHPKDSLSEIDPTSYKYFDEKCVAKTLAKYDFSSMNEAMHRHAVLFEEGKPISTNEFYSSVVSPQLDEKRVYPMEDKIAYVMEHDSKDNVKKMVYGMLGNPQEREAAFSFVQEREQDLKSQLSLHKLLDKEHVKESAQAILQFCQENPNVDVSKVLKAITKEVAKGRESMKDTEKDFSR